MDSDSRVHNRSFLFSCSHNDLLHSVCGEVSSAVDILTNCKPVADFEGNVQKTRVEDKGMDEIAPITPVPFTEGPTLLCWICACGQYVQDGQTHICDYQGNAMIDQS